MTATATASPSGTPTQTPNGTPTATPTASPSGTPPNPKPGDQIFVRGDIQAISGPFFIVAGNTVFTDPTHTVFHNADGTPTTASAFNVGDRVRVLGFVQTDGSIFAQKFSFDTP
jgi:hypothetical protein